MMDVDYELEELLQEQLYEFGLPPMHMEQVQHLAECVIRVYGLVPKRTSLDKLYHCMKQYVATPIGAKTISSLGKRNKQRYNNVIMLNKDK